MLRIVLVLTFAATAALAAVIPAFADDPAYGGTAVKSVTATLVDTTGASIGTVQLHQDAAGVVLVRIDAAGLSAGAHGVHIHTTGLCEGPTFTSAGGHLNPTQQKHGLDNPAGPHAGDLAQIPPSFDGTDTYTATTNRISLLGGPTWIEDADGTALVIHAAADDQVTDPTGNSGGRIACAVLSAPKKAPLPPNTGSGLETATGLTAVPLTGLVVLLLLCASAAWVGMSRQRR